MNLYLRDTASMSTERGISLLVYTYIMKKLCICVHRLLIAVKLIPSPNKHNKIGFWHVKYLSGTRVFHISCIFFPQNFF